ncbi:WD40 repeat-like protein [Ramicandelaber brevisporus]|nr:WD40 repeat-like protein [Ramicandelaber brevisporus]
MTKRSVKSKTSTKTPVTSKVTAAASIEHSSRKQQQQQPQQKKKKTTTPPPPAAVESDDSEDYKDDEDNDEEDEDEIDTFALGAPPPLTFKSNPLDIAFHPSDDLIAVGLLTGKLQMYRLSDQSNGLVDNKRVHSIKAHSKSIRGVTFNHDGSRFVTVSRDKSWQLFDTSSGAPIQSAQKAHNAAINCVKQLNENVMATGDDNGCVKIWDMRTASSAAGSDSLKPAQQFTENADFIADMAFQPDKRYLFTAGGDGCMAVYDIRKPKPVAVSENQDDELLSIQVMKNGSKVIYGSQDGVIGLFTSGQWLDVTDRFLGHPASIDTICKIDEDTAVTGSSDGMIRYVSILPNKLLGVIGEHGDFPIEQLRIDHSRKVLASCSHDNTVRFWNINELTHPLSDIGSDVDDEDIAVRDKSDSEEEAEEVEEKVVEVPKSKKRDTAKSKANQDKKRQKADKNREQAEQLSSFFDDI